MSTTATETPKPTIVEEQQKEQQEKKVVEGSEKEQGGEGEETECEVDVRQEFKSCIDETLQTVCRVASMKRKVQAENK